MFIGQNMCCQDVSSPETDLYIQCNPNHNTSRFLIEIDKQIVKHIRKRRGPGIAKTILKKNNVGELILLLYIITYDKAAVTHIVQYQDVYRSTSRTEQSLETDPHMFGQ